jgi:hypothetical protein
MDRDERAEFMREQRELHAQRKAEFQRELVDREIATPLPDPIDAWREKIAPFDEMRRKRQRAKERRLAAPPRVPTDLIDERVRALAEAERRYILDIVTESVGSFVGTALKETDEEIKRLKDDVARLRDELAAARGENVVRFRDAS